MTISQLKQFSEAFLLPILVLVSIIAYCILYIINFKTVGTVIILAGVFAGSFDMVKETIQSLIKKQFALDYIAIIAILVAIITGQYLVAGILALMISSGTTLENYGVNQAKRSLTQLIERIPQEVTLWIANAPDGKEKIRDVKVGTHIFVRKGEVIPLDGILLSDIGETDESSLTGEPYFISKNKGDEIRSGTVNIGQPMVIEVTKKEEESTYHKIINLVKSAQDEKSPFIRLADKYSTIFTIVTFSIAGVAFVISGGSLDRVLAVLAVATPCPLIIATPIALLGGMNASAKQKIIIKKLASLEVLARINTIVFDKTGTITLGKPVISSITVEKGITEEFALSIASAIERNSLHPLAKAIVSEAQQRKIKHQTAHQVKEIIGKGITGVVQNKEYSLSKLKERLLNTIRTSIQEDKESRFYYFGLKKFIEQGA
jgi:P-type E1-E2 ATPase